MKIAIKAYYCLILLLLFSCETKTPQKESLGVCGGGIGPSYNYPVLVEENCLPCHDIEHKIVGASFKEISKRNLSKQYFFSLLEDPTAFNKNNKKIQHPANYSFNEKEALIIYNWLDSLKHH